MVNTKKKVVVLGSTGSIGRNTLEVIQEFPREFCVVGLSTYRNINLLSKQVKLFKPKKVAVVDGLNISRKNFLDTRIYFGQEGLIKLVNDKEVDIVVVAVSGSAALMPILEAINSKKIIALANKEALVMAGNIIMNMARQKNVTIIPIDSEQSAIWQCLQGNNKKEVSKIYLTASGGPLNNISVKRFSGLSKKIILNHPRWKMGKKITVDSANMMNKGLEIIEAKWLFGIEVGDIEVIIHPEAIIHSMIEFIDGSILAQLSTADMRFPIQYALTYPRRYKSGFKKINFTQLKALNFQKPDFRKFPCLNLAYQAAQDAATAPCVLNAANEEAVSAFLDDRLRFINIPRVIEKILSKHKKVQNPNLNEILQADYWARTEAKKFIEQLLN